MVSSIVRNGQIEDGRSLNNSLNLPPSPLFGTDGIRGKAGELLTAPFALQLGYCAGHLLKEQASGNTIIIGQDSRCSSDMLASAISAGLTSVGIEVWQLGLCPTPCVAHLTQTTDAIGGIMISASHNPPEDNGIKFFSAQGSKLSSAIARQIETTLREPTLLPAPTPQWGTSHYKNELTHHYRNFLHQTLAKGTALTGLRVVLDLAWGAAVDIAPAVFRALGAEVFCLHERADGDRINVQCGSTHLQSLQQAVLELNADLGFAFDGDADRVMAVDSLGRPVDGDYILYLWGQQLQQRGQLPHNLLVGTVMANLGFERAWQQLGGQLLRTAVGDQHVQAQMWETGAMLGGEQSGHIICHHHSYSGDGVQSALHLAALVQESGTCLADLVNDSFQPYPQLLTNVRVLDRERRLGWQDCEPLQEAIAKAEQALGSSGRILVRASGTEPLIRVMVEAAEDAMAKFWTQQLVRIVNQYLAA